MIAFWCLPSLRPSLFQFLMTGSLHGLHGMS